MGRNGTLSAAVEPADTLDAELVFVGYGLDVPEARYSDLKGVDLRGKIAVYVRSGPDTLPPTVRSHAQATDVRWSGLRAAGAVGYISVSPMFRRGGGVGAPLGAGAPPGAGVNAAAGAALGTAPGAGVFNRRAPGIALDDVTLDPLAGAHFSMRINGGYFDSLLAGTGHTAKDLFALSDSAERLPVFPLSVKLHARVRADSKHVLSPNVVGIIPGSVPKLRDQYVVVSAHLDHLGVGEPVKGDSIYNGAMDNASGVASLIEFARYAKAAKSPFRRSVILLAVTGEEQQLLGSWWYAARPTVPKRAIVADINLDMFLPIMPLRTITVYGRTESDLGERFAAVAAKAGVAADDDHESQRNYFIRSDQYSFIRAGGPSLFFEIGAGADTAAATKLAAWNRDNYHKVSDDLDQPVDLEVAAAFTHLLYDFTRDVANAPDAPKWKPGSFFRRFARAGSPALRGARVTGLAPRRTSRRPVAR